MAVTILGIDPGQSGGIAFVGYTNPFAYPMPDNMADIWDCFAGPRASLHAYIEEVHAMPKQGVSSTFKFGMGYGALLMALTAAGIPFTRVRPQVWQKEMGCMSRGDKNVTKRRAQELFPGLKVTHAIADALLIAEYGRRVHK